MTRNECTEILLSAKLAKGFTFHEIAAHVGRHEVWVASAILGQQAMGHEEASRLVEFLNVPPMMIPVLCQSPMKGSLDTSPPVDPLIYRFHEIVQVYGTTLKALIHEKFGDGIMSAIDFTMNLEKVPDPKGDRVKVTLDGKFLPYKKW